MSHRYTDSCFYFDFWGSEVNILAIHGQRIEKFDKYCCRYWENR